MRPRAYGRPGADPRAVSGPGHIVVRLPICVPRGVVELLRGTSGKLAHVIDSTGQTQIANLEKRT
ncbi:MAG TPA: hypothetical protein VJ717_19130 [Gemmatimonadaceae bacterium]|nr:hypothetical protein [Gemmatimonadaceae bacterium]